MVLLDGIIRTGRLCAFLESFYTELRKEDEEHLKEVEERTMWEFWLHKVFTKESYKEFRESLQKSNDTQADRPSDEELQAIVNESAQIMQGFRPS